MTTTSGYETLQRTLDLADEQRGEVMDAIERLELIWLMLRLDGVPLMFRPIKAAIGISASSPVLTDYSDNNANPTVPQELLVDLKRYDNDSPQTYAANLPTSFPDKPGDRSEEQEPQTRLWSLEALPDDDDVQAALRRERVGAQSLRLRQVPLLPRPLEILSPLGPLLKKRPHSRWRVLDEQRSAELSADLNFAWPVFQPKFVPAVEVCLVLDAGVSMEPWKPLAEELQRVLASSQAFARVELERLNPDSLRLDELGVFANSALLSREPSRLVLLLSDTLGQHWRDGSIHGWLKAKTKRHPLAIVHMLPIRYWERTALKFGQPVNLTNSHPLVANERYRFIPRKDQDPSALESQRDQQVILPVIALDLPQLNKWANLVIGNHPVFFPCTLLPPGPLGDERRPGFEILTQQQGEELWLDFREWASEDAQRLFRLMAAAPLLTLPVLRLLQAANFPGLLSPQPLAEVLVSGLVCRMLYQDQKTPPDKLQFEIPAAFRQLLESEPEEKLDPQALRDVIGSVTDLLERRWNRQENVASFEALLTDPSKPLPLSDAAGMIHFANVTATMLERLPGKEFQDIAARLRAGVGLAPPPIWPSSMEFKDLPFETAKLLPIPASDRISFSTARYQEIELLSISFKTAKLTIISKLEDRTKKKNSQQPVVEIHRSRGSAQVFYEPLLRKYLPPGATAEAADPLTLTLVEIQKGEFLMGSPPEELERYDDEGPWDLVELESFFMGQTPITQAQWREVAGWQPWDWESWGRELNQNPSSFRGGDNQKGGEARLFDGEVNTDQRPVERVSWEDAIEFCNRLTQRTGRHYSLPSEAQWEYACRADSRTPFHFGETISSELANYDATELYGDGLKGDYRLQTTPVDRFPANAWGLQDMHGNVWEWCLDQWHPNYEGAPVDGSAWVDADANQANVKKDEESDRRLLRGGSWNSHPWICRSASRGHRRPGYVSTRVGLRVVCLP